MGIKIAFAATHLRFFCKKSNTRERYGGGMAVLNIKI